MFTKTSLVYCPCSLYETDCNDVRIPRVWKYPPECSALPSRDRSNEMTTHAAVKMPVNKPVASNRKNGPKLKFGIDAILYGCQPTDLDHSSQPTSSVADDKIPKRKRHWSRPVFSQLQRHGLEKRFQMQKYVTKQDRFQLASMLGLSESQIKVWFQNRRTKWRQEIKDEHRKEMLSSETGCTE